ncbi:conserved Plasmodium protein, unknown function [Plasmodium ovale]|uniref:DUF4536 domain-containing protein n=2 Tax=Plasmodium ovale TaxID=36330 RepID=A0A1A8VSY0_PLAOA|nr:conserved Plasmodium protein, unknown function [Plasmodium ovale curtisi]SBS91059.1 conserved Plasmodium protein, unknown function [Plasmodium ovale curtisi]SCP04535.1 conserved Plasmodium protein, unknown function [Plasmodium ovale]
MNISLKGNADDCIFCRVTGTVILGSVSVYSFLKFLQAKKGSGDKRFFGFISLCFGVLSAYRAITPARPIRKREGPDGSGELEG